MKKGLFLTLAFIACFGIGTKSFADGMDPELEIFVKKENANTSLS